MAGLSPSPDTQAALGDTVAGAFAGEAKLKSSEISGAQTRELKASLGLSNAEQSLRGLKEASPTVLDAAASVMRGLATVVEWRAQRIGARAAERAVRAQKHNSRLAEMRQTPIENAEAERKAMIASEVLRALDLPGGGTYQEKPLASRLAERWEEHWAHLDTRRAARDEMSSENYRGAAKSIRAAAEALRAAWDRDSAASQEGMEISRANAAADKDRASEAARAAQEAFDRVMQQGPAEAIAARGEIMATRPDQLAAQKTIAEQRTQNVVSAGTTI